MNKKKKVNNKNVYRHLYCMVSAQKNNTVKAYTHSHIYSHIQTELNNSNIENSQNFEYKYLAALFTGSKKS